MASGERQPGQQSVDVHVLGSLRGPIEGQVLPWGDVKESGGSRLGRRQKVRDRTPVVPSAVGLRTRDASSRQRTLARDPPAQELIHRLRRCPHRASSPTAVAGSGTRREVLDSVPGQQMRDHVHARPRVMLMPSLYESRGRVAGGGIRLRHPRDRPPNPRSRRIAGPGRHLRLPRRPEHLDRRPRVPEGPRQPGPRLPPGLGPLRGTERRARPRPVGATPSKPWRPRPGGACQRTVHPTVVGLPAGC